MRPSGGLEDVDLWKADDIWIHPAKPGTELQGGRDHRAVGLWYVHGKQRDEGLSQQEILSMGKVTRRPGMGT